MLFHPPSQHTTVRCHLHGAVSCGMVRAVAPLAFGVAATAAHFSCADGFCPASPKKSVTRSVSLRLLLDRLLHADCTLLLMLLLLACTALPGVQGTYWVGGYRTVAGGAFVWIDSTSPAIMNCGASGCGLPLAAHDPRIVTIKDLKRWLCPSWVGVQRPHRRAPQLHPHRMHPNVLGMLQKSS